MYGWASRDGEAFSGVVGLTSGTGRASSKHRLLTLKNRDIDTLFVLRLRICGNHDEEEQDLRLHKKRTDPRRILRRLGFHTYKL